jgi:hypothetical protein
MAENEVKELDLHSTELTEAAHAKFAEIEAKEPKVEEAPKAEEPKAEPVAAEATPEEPKEPAAGPAATPEAPATPTPAEGKAAEKRVLKALLGGQIQDVNEDDLVKLAQMGYTAQEVMRSVEQERMRIAEQGQKLGALMEKIRPHQERLNRMEQEEREQEHLDPSIALKREQDALRQRVEAFERAQQQQMQQSQAQHELANFNARLAGARAKHEAFKIIESNPELNRRVTESIYGAIARGAPLDVAVEQEAKFYSGILAKAKTEQKIEGIKKATEKAKLPNTPGKGVGPTTPERKLDRKSLYNGEAFKIAMERFASADQG